MNPLVTVIVPVFRASEFIERCANTLLSQTYDNIEFYFVNDCTPDNSIELLEKVVYNYPNRIPSVNIINFDNNQGHAHARNVALKRCHGEYVIQIDADDWIEETMIEKMLHSAIENNSDIVACDFVREEKDKSVYWSVNVEDLGREGILNYKWILEYSAHWNKLVRLSLIRDNNIFCIEGTNNWVDVGQIAPLRFMAKRISVVNDGLYHYNAYNENSVSRHVTEKRINDMLKVAKVVTDFISCKTNKDFTVSLEYLRFLSKYPLITKGRSEYRRWLSTFSSSNRYILKYPIPKSHKLFFWLAAHYVYIPLTLFRRKHGK